MNTYRPLSSEEIQTMESAGCRASEWSQVQVSDGFDATRVRSVRFSGQVRLGALRGSVELDGGVELPAEITNASHNGRPSINSRRPRPMGMPVRRWSVRTSSWAVACPWAGARPAPEPSARPHLP